MRNHRSPGKRAVGAGAFSRSPAVDDGAPDPPAIIDLFPHGEAAQHAVYFITSRDLQPLYIGSSSQLMRRLREHARDRDWFTPDCRIFVEWFCDRDDAYLRETHAIASARPAHNRRFDQPSQPCPTPDVPLRPLTDLERDTADLCLNCGHGHVRADGRCRACHNYRERHGVDRPSAMWGRWTRTA